jgi:hypothetical protein
MSDDDVRDLIEEFLADKTQFHVDEMRRYLVAHGINDAHAQLIVADWDARERMDVAMAEDIERLREFLELPDDPWQMTADHLERLAYFMEAAIEAERLGRRRYFVLHARVMNAWEDSGCATFGEFSDVRPRLAEAYNQADAEVCDIRRTLDACQKYEAPIHEGRR